MTIRRSVLRLVGSLLALAPALLPTPAAAEEAATPAAGSHGAVVFFGDSLTAGLGLSPEEAYPALLGERIAAAGLPFEVVNAGTSGDTTAAGLRRVNWVLRQHVAVFVLALGANDGLRGLPLDETERNLQAIIDAVRERQPAAQIVLAGMQMPPSLGADYAGRFRALFPRLAAKNGVALVPFILEGVGGVPAMNQADGIHPTAAGQRIVADNVWRTLEPVLRRQIPG